MAKHEHHWVIACFDCGAISGSEAAHAARSTLADKVLAVVEAEHLEGYIEGEKVGYAVTRGRNEDDIAYDTAINHALAALRELFEREGISTVQGEKSLRTSQDRYSIRVPPKRST